MSRFVPKEVIVLGTGGNCIDIVDSINDINSAQSKEVYRCIGYLDDDESKWGKEYAGVRVLGPLSSAVDYRHAFFVNGIGSVRNFWKKESIIRSTGIEDERFLSIKHPTASVSSLAKIGAGSVILQNVSININVWIGKHVTILPNCAISHDDRINDYTCLASSVSVAGNVTIGRFCYLGINSTVNSYIDIGDYCLIGMGSAVLRAVKENSVVVGNPARFLRATR